MQWIALSSFWTSGTWASVVQRLDSAIHRINLYTVDRTIMVSLILIHWRAIYLVDSAIQCLNHGGSFPKEQNRINKFTARVSDKKSQVEVWWNYRFSFKQASCVKKRERERERELRPWSTSLHPLTTQSSWRYKGQEKQLTLSST